MSLSFFRWLSVDLVSVPRQAPCSVLWEPQLPLGFKLQYWCSSQPSLTITHLYCPIYIFGTVRGSLMAERRVCCPKIARARSPSRFSSHRDRSIVYTSAPTTERYTSSATGSTVYMYTYFSVCRRLADRKDNGLGYYHSSFPFPANAFIGLYSVCVRRATVSHLGLIGPLCSTTVENLRTYNVFRVIL